MTACRARLAPSLSTTGAIFETFSTTGHMRQPMIAIVEFRRNAASARLIALPARSVPSAGIAHTSTAHCFRYL